MASPSPVVIAAVNRASVVGWGASTWRMHQRIRGATSVRGSQLISGRFNRAADDHPPEICFSALYTSLRPETCMGEVLRHTAPPDMGKLRDARLSEIAVSLQVVLDFRDPDTLGVSLEQLLAPRNYALGQEVAEAAIRRGCEALLVPSATQLGDNLIVFPQSLLEGSRIELIHYRDLEQVYYVGG